MSETATTFYVTGGTLRVDAPSYVARKADRDLLEGLLANEFCYVLTSRQMGKSSLMVRTANRLRERGTKVIVLDLSAVGQNVTQEQWYNGLLATVGDQLGIEDELDAFWAANQGLGPVQRWFKAIRKVVVSRCSAPVVIFIDEIDVVRSLHFSTDEFFAAIRECYNRRATNPEFSLLTFCLLGVATPSDLVRNTNITPFNIGRRIDLNDFTAEEAGPLARGLQPEEGSASKPLERVLYWTSGHPYLTQRLCQELARNLRANQPDNIDNLCDQLFLSRRARERDDNLIFVRERLLRSEVPLADLLELYLKVWKRERVFADEASSLVSVLRLSGIARTEGGRLVERNRIYHAVFDRNWVKSNLPDAELMRQRAAFRRGVFRTMSIAAVVLVAMTVTVIIAIDRAQKAGQALAQSAFSRAQATRVSGVSGQRLESIVALKAAASGYFSNATALRDELIAAVALPDLKDETLKYPVLKATNLYEIDPDNKFIATAEPGGQIAIRSLDTGIPIRLIPSAGSTVRNLRFSPNSLLLLAEYSESSTSETVLWDWRKADRLFSVAQPVHGEAVDFSFDGSRLALCQSNGHLTVFSLPDGEIIFERELKWDSGLPRIPQVLRFDPAARYLAESSLGDPYVQVWDLDKDKHSKPARLYHPEKVADLSWHPGGEFLAAACGDGQIYMWRMMPAPRLVKKLKGHENESKVTALAFNHSGTLLASAGDDETIRLWVDATDRHFIQRLEAETVSRLRFSDDDRHLLSTGFDPSRQRVWEVSGGEYIVLNVPTESHDPLRSVDFSPNGSRVCATTGERTTMWDADTGAELGYFATTNAHGAAFTENSDSLIVGTGDGLLQVNLSSAWAGRQSRLEARVSCIFPQGFQELFKTVAFNPGGTSAALMQQRRAVLVRTGTNCPTESRSIPLKASYHRLALDPNGNWMAGSLDGSKSVDLYHLPGATNQTAPVTIPSSPFYTFSGDGKWFVACYDEGYHFYKVGSWEKAQFKIPRKPRSDQHAPVAFSGSIAAVAISRYTVQLFQLFENSTAPKLIATLESPDRNPLELLVFSDDGQRLAAATVDRTIQIWNLARVRQQLAAMNLDKDWPSFP